MEWLSRIVVFSIGAVAGFAGAIALVVATIEPASQTEIDEIAKMDATFRRLPEHEALVAKILSAISLKSRIRVYLDPYNPSFCGHADAWHQTIVLTERCSELKRKDGRYNWFVVQKLGHEIGHIISGHGLGNGVAENTPAWQQDDADEFSGWVLKRLGASLDEARASIAPEPSPFSYPIPPEPSSLAAVERGWRNDAAAE